MTHRRRYRLRTWLREHLPEPFAPLFPPGSRDCGDHEWFRADDRTDRCWHCTVGEREHRPAPIDPESELWQELLEVARKGDPTSRQVVLRMMAEHEAYEALVTAALGDTAAQFDIDASGFQRRAKDAAKLSSLLAAAAERGARA